jgi:hypothetical protein
VRLLLRRRESQSLGLDETECYRRCHGERDGEVRVLSPVRVLPRETNGAAQPADSGAQEANEAPTPNGGAELPTYWSKPVNPRISGEEMRRQFLARLEARGDQ